MSYQLLLAQDLGLLEKTMFDGMDSDLSEIMRMMSSLSHSVKVRPSTVKVDLGAGAKG